MAEDALSGLSIQRGRTIAEQTRDQLRDMIVTGAIPENTTLSEYELARRLSISRSPLREAIHQLQEEGLLDQTGPRGVTVPPVTREFVKNLYEVRDALEVKAATIATMPSVAELDQARDVLEAAKNALDAGDPTPFTASDFDFHDLYIIRSGNPMLISHIGRLRSNVQRVQNFANPLIDHIEASYHEHSRILEALAATDNERLAKLVGEHIRGVSDRLMPYIEP